MITVVTLMDQSERMASGCRLPNPGCFGSRSPPALYLLCAAAAVALACPAWDGGAFRSVVHSWLVEEWLRSAAKSTFDVEGSHQSRCTF